MSLEIRNGQAEAVLYFFEVAGGWLKRRVRWNGFMDQFRNAAAAARPNFNGTAWHNVTTRMPVGGEKTFRSRFELWQVVMTVSDEKHISKQI